jgi:hypothetical protein
MKEAIASLDRITSVEVPDDILLYRGMVLPPDVADHLKAGAEFLDLGFTSTSADEKTAISFARQPGGESVVFVINPKGFRGIDIRSIAELNEEELILGRNQPMRITKIETKGALKYVYVEAR